MAKAKFIGVRVAGIACAVPQTVKTSISYNDVLDRKDIDAFINAVGVLEHPVAVTEQTASDLCFVAARELLKHLNYQATDLDVLIFVTQTADYSKPATSHVLHKRLSCSMDCACFDINLGCSGFVYGLNAAAALVSSGSARRVLLLTGERDRWPSEQPVKDVMLFSPAGAATLVERDEGEINTLLKSDGNRYRAILRQGDGVRLSNLDKEMSSMDGEAVFSFTISEVPQLFKSYFADQNVSFEDFDLCILHQANLMIIKCIQKKLHIPVEKLAVSIDRYGNTSSASIPLGICDKLGAVCGHNTKRIISAGFGVGLSWGIADFSVSPDHVLPIIQSDEFYEEA